MTSTVFLVFNRKGVQRLNKSYMPDLKAGEHCVQLNLEVPDSFFNKDVPQITLRVPGQDSGIVPVAKIDPTGPGVEVVDEALAKQSRINTAAGKLLQKALACGDQGMQAEALDILNSLRDEGIEVNVEVPTTDTEEVSP